MIHRPLTDSRLNLIAYQSCGPLKDAPPHHHKESTGHNELIRYV
jgi:hypothetical protein